MEIYLFYIQTQGNFPINKIHWLNIDYKRLIFTSPKHFLNMEFYHSIPLLFMDQLALITIYQPLLYLIIRQYNNPYLYLTQI